MDEELLTAAELAKRLRVRPGTVRVWAREGRIPALRPTARVIRFDMRAVMAALDPRPGEVWFPTTEPACETEAPR